MDKAHIRENILRYANDVINRNFDELPFEGEVGELLSKRYTLEVSDLLILANKLRVYDTMMKARA